ncbi:unnamed protein product [Symbiodinium natans]|uniref:Uncharacterized protein n=1 Tax=Symbiodinium natans TaxID=878477 RepID=A0A812IDK9_9DINO|nr:unnamed protein product [Symbiodinium natans]
MSGFPRSPSARMRTRSEDACLTGLRPAVRSSLVHRQTHCHRVSTTTTRARPMLARTATQEGPASPVAVVPRRGARWWWQLPSCREVEPGGTEAPSTPP